MALQLAAILFEIADGVAVVGEEKAAVFLSRVDLDVVIVAIEVRRGDFGPLVDFTYDRFVFEPLMVRVGEALNVADHEESPRLFNLALSTTYGIRVVESFQRCCNTRVQNGRTRLARVDSRAGETDAIPRL